MEGNQVLPGFEKPPEADSVFAVEESIRRHVKYSLAKTWNDLSSNDLLAAVAPGVLDPGLADWTDLARLMR